MDAIPEARSFKGLEVLVADDSAVNREVIVQALRQLDIAPDVVENGLQALSQVKVKSYDIILMDGSMPEMDGFTATRLIREDENAQRKKPVPIIALTAHVAGDAANAWKECGMNARVLKPFTMELLTNCIAEWCENKSALPAMNLKDSKNSATSTPVDVEGGQPVLNPAVLNSLREISGDMGDAMLDRLFSIYRENAPDALHNLDAACNTGDLIKISGAAHALKSMSGNIAASRLATICEHLEQQSAAGVSKNVSALQAAIGNEFVLVMDEIAAADKPVLSETKAWA